MVRVLEAHGVETTAVEVEGKGHWWWDTDETNDGGVMFDASVRVFLDKYGNRLPGVSRPVNYMLLGRPAPMSRSLRGRRLSSFY